MQRNIRLCTVILLTMMLCVMPARANIRGPHADEYAASGALVPDAGLIVESEHLSFAMGKPFTGDIYTVLKTPRFANISAQYSVLATEEKTHTFEFIMADANPATAEINGVSVPTSIPMPTAGNETSPNKQWKVGFSGKLSKGRNAIRFSYRQPVSKREIRYGYFVASKWESAVEYELWPLKEWKLAPDFTLHIEANIEDDTSPLKKIFGSSNHTVKIVTPSPLLSRYHYPEIAGATIQRLDDKIIYRLKLGARFPDRIRVLSTEGRLADDYPTENWNTETH